MDDTTAVDTEPVAETVVRTEPVAPADEAIEDELLVEEVSIDGMCGVY